MQPRLEFLGQHVIYHALALNAAHTGEGICRDLQAEMALARSVMAGMPRMPVAVIDQRQRLRLERRGQF